MVKSIFIDATPLGGGISGAGRYAYKLLNELLPRIGELSVTVLAPPEGSRNWEISHWEELDGVEVQLVNTRGIGPKRQIHYLFRRFDANLFHSLSSYAPLFIDGPVVTTIHDLKYVKVPSYFEGLSPLKHYYVKKMIRWSAKNSTRIITVSDYTRTDIESEFGIHSEKISAIPLGPGDVQPEIAGSPPVSNPYLFFVGELRPHKNVQTLIKAYNILRDRNEALDIDLVIAGSEYGGALDELKREVNNSYQNQVHFLGRVNDETLARLYKHATVFVFPSFYEGFGLPPLEAMGYGTPVIVSNRTSIPEVVGDAGLYFDPENETELSELIEQVLTDESVATDLKSKSRNRFSEFSWERTAKETLDVYQEILR